MARAVAAAGHEIGNHGYAHQRWWLRSPRFIYEDLARAQAVIAETTGVNPTLFRAPYGVRWFGLRAAQRQLNMLGVMWTTLARNWKLPATGIAARLLRAAANGAIFCLHDGRLVESNPDVSPMLEAVERLLPALRERRFRLETVSGLLGLSSRAAGQSGSK